MVLDELQLKIIESNDDDKNDLQKNIDQTFQKLDKKCDIIIEKIKKVKLRKVSAA